MMNESKPLHWSFNHNYGAQRIDFAETMLKTLNAYQSDTSNIGERTKTKQNERRVYQILPNTWRGYKGRNDGLSIGKVVIKRKYDENNIWNYNVQYKNTTSGEDIRFTFCCRDEHYLPLHDSWNVDVRNTSSDRYSTLSLNGSFTSQGKIQLSINDTDIGVGTMEDSLPLTCNWALLDVIPQLAKNRGSLDSKIAISLLEDLEHFRHKCYLGFLDTIQYPIQLDGYFLYGNGLLPSYWWIDANDRVAIVSAVFETLVLKEYTVCPS